MLNTSKQWRLFRLACQFFTRIPVGNIADFQETDLNQATRYFSLVGLLVAAILSAVFSILVTFFPVNLAVVLLLIVSVLLTGAFHEDGLADMADGIGGGYTISSRLAIMKDSRLGTYGAISLFLVMLLKYVVLVHLANAALIIFSLFLAHACSRAIAASLIIDTPYVSEESDSKSKPLAQQQTQKDCLFVLLVAVVPFFFLPNVLFSFTFVISLLFTLYIFRVLFRRWLIARIGGFTGDCLGACQQLVELIIYLLIVAFAIGGVK
ncbi:adenosylcobinamide-GDP ribazoletransferase [Thalassotalea hakodatensis]|uniref:adenosylcobinamide-GDP ribazoletransferase n=1 Tax=Thalassotalea hakodatensis TaxID=3030492 RepID=UPI0025733E2E|nr:adenosylcobinamide-GDP ribazoletransferase [Thalassotalea hakodatensis]